MKAFLISALIFSPLFAFGADEKPETDWSKAIKLHTGKEMDKTFPKVYFFLPQEELPTSMVNTNVQIVTRSASGDEMSYALPDFKNKKGMIVAGMLGKTSMVDGKQVATYKMTQTVDWQPPGARSLGISIKGEESKWLTTDKEGVLVDLGVNPIPLYIKTGKASENPDFVDYVDLTLKYKILGKDIAVAFDLRKSSIKGKEEGTFESELLVPSNSKEELKFTYELRYFSKKGIKKINGGGTHSSKDDSHTLTIKFE